MGEWAYAVAMAHLLDPTGRFIGDRIISQGDGTHRTRKDLDVVLGAESAVLILDDTEGVWPKHGANLVLMESYHFFACRRRRFRVGGPSLTEKGSDKSEKEGALDMTFKRLRLIQQTVFIAANPIERGLPLKTTDNADGRNVIENVKGRTLDGCRVAFSRVYPAGHPLWHLAAKLGAQRSAVTNSSTTHVVALDRGTEKARWAKENGEFLVHPCWTEAANYLWCQPQEDDFPVGNDSPPPPAGFAKTVPSVAKHCY